MEHMEHVPHVEHKKKEVNLTFDGRSFWAGAIAAIVAICVVGFFILLVLVLTGASFGSAQVLKKTVPTDTNQPVDPNSEPTTANIPSITKDDYIRGEKNATVTIVEYSDTECPFCKRFHDTLVKTVADSKGSVNWVYRHFPLATLHAKAPKEAEALECAGEQGGNDGFWKYLDRLMEVTPSNDGLDVAQLPVIAKFAGLNVDKFNTCLSSGKFAAKVQEQYDQAVTSGGRGTPYSVLVGPDGQMVPLSGALPQDQLQAAIDSLLK